MCKRLCEYFEKKNRVLFFLSVTMWTMITLTVIAILFTLFKICFPLPLSLTYQGIINFLSKFVPFHSLFSGTIMLMTIYVALASYLRSKQLEAIKGMQDIRKMLMTEDNMRIHELLEWDNDEEKKQKENIFKSEFEKRQGVVYNYMGILELSKIYLDEGIITIEQFKEQFGYRIDNIYNNPLIKKWINFDPNNWQTLNALHELSSNKK